MTINVCETFNPWLNPNIKTWLQLHIVSFRKKYLYCYCWPKMGGKTWGLWVYVLGLDSDTESLLFNGLSPSNQNCQWAPIKVISPIIHLGCSHPREDWSSPTMPTYLLRHLLKKAVFLNSWQYLQVSNSNATADCWLCIKPWPSCYVGIATLSSQGNQPFNIRKLIVDELKSQQCPWAKWSPSLMQELKGKGTCFHSE